MQYGNHRGTLRGPMWMLDAVARPLNRLPGAHGKGSTTGQRHTSPLHAWRARRMNHCAFFRETELLSFAIRRGTSFRKGSKKEEKEKEKLLSMDFVKENFWRRIAFLWGASKGLEKKLDPRMDLWNRWREFLVAFLHEELFLFGGRRGISLRTWRSCSGFDSRMDFIRWKENF